MALIPFSGGSLPLTSSHRHAKTAAVSAFIPSSMAMMESIMQLKPMEFRDLNSGVPILSMDKCTFCDIAAKHIPAAMVYEDADFVAFLDINPLNPGHTLVVPKRHVRWVFDVEKFGDYWEVAKTVALAAIEVLEAKTVNFITAGAGVEHAHIHVVPRFDNDGHGELPNTANVKHIPKEEMASIASKLAEAIARNPPKKAVVATVPKVEETPAESQPEETLSGEEVALIRREFESG